MGSTLSTFTDFMNSTGPAFLTSAEELINEAVKNKYLLRRFLKGSDMTRTLQGGSTIKDEIMFDENSTRQHYSPNDTFSWQHPQVLSEWSVSWRFTADHMSWTDQEIELNTGSGLGRSARHQAYKRLKRIKEMRLWTSFLNGMEDDLFAVPDRAQMEASTGEKPYSIPCFINGNANGTPRDAAGAAWTSDQVMGLSGSANAKWKPQVVTYAEDASGTVSDNLFNAFDEMFHKVRFDQLPTREEFSDGTSGAQFIACSLSGLTEYQNRLRASQDTFVASGRQDPAYTTPKYAGIDLVYVSNLDTAAVYNDDTASALVVESSTTNNNLGPRYYWINGKYISPIFHSERYMTRHPVMTHPNQPFTHVQVVDCWHNLVCRSRQRQGLVAPSNDHTLGN